MGDYDTVEFVGGTLRTHPKGACALAKAIEEVANETNDR